MHARHGFRTYDYGNFATAGSRWTTSSKDSTPDDTRQKVWRTFDARPRFGNNYVGIRNRIAILSEAYSYLDFERRVKATEAFVEEIMRFVAAHGDAIRSLTSTARCRMGRRRHATRAGRRVATAGAAQARRRARRRDRQQGQSTIGQGMRTMIEIDGDPDEHDRLRPFRLDGVTRRVPAEYIVPASANGLHDIVERKLREHGIQVERIEKASRRTVEQFVLTQVRHAEQAFQGHRATSVEGRFERRDIDVPAGSLVVRTKQPLGRLVFYLLEPESDDGLTTWNFLDEALRRRSAPRSQITP